MGDDQEPMHIDKAQQSDGPVAVLAAFRPVLRQPRLLLLSVGVPFAIGLAVGAASSSLLIGAGAFVVAGLAPILALFRLATPHD